MYRGRSKTIFLLLSNSTTGESPTTSTRNSYRNSLIDLLFSQFIYNSCTATFSPYALILDYIALHCIGVPVQLFCCPLALRDEVGGEEVDPGAGQIGRRTEIAAIARPVQICKSTTRAHEICF